MPDKKILYHGTGKTIGEFNRHTYFATDPKISDRYATYRRGEAPQMYRVEAKLKNPAYMDDFRKSKEELGEDAINEDVFSHLESKGFDHFLPYGKNSKEIVIFDPNKSTLPKFEDGGKVDNDGITAYHGSPHDFEQFDVSKIGSGEGAQSFGHGLYFSEEEPTAINYRDRLAKEHATTGNTIADEFAIDPKWQKTMNEEDIAEHLDDIKRKAEKVFFQNGKQKYVFHDGSILTDEGDHFRADQKEKGHMYEVRINAHPDHFLDWDKPILEQPEVAAKLFNGPGFIKNTARQAVHKNNEITYGELHGQFAAKHPHGQQGLTEHLREMGIPGIKYLDQGSRGTGHGSRNYVVFDDKLVNVNRKYEDGGTVN